MYKKYKNSITPTQLFFLTAEYIMSGMLLHCGANIAGKDAWLSAAVAALLGILTALIYCLAAEYHFKRSTNDGFTGWLRRAFGRTAGNIAAMFYLIFFAFYSASEIYRFSEYLHKFSANEISAGIFAAVLLAICVFVVWRGPAVLGRTAEISSAFAVCILIIIFCGFSAVTDFNEYLPLFISEREDIVYGTLASFVSPFCDAAVFLCFFGKVIPAGSKKASVYARAKAEIIDETQTGSKKKQQSGIGCRTFLFAAALSALIFVVTVLRDEMLFGAELLQKLTYPSALAAELISKLDLRPIFDLCLAILYIIRIAVIISAVHLILSEFCHKNRQKALPLISAAALSAAGTVLFYTLLEPSALLVQAGSSNGMIFIRGSLCDDIFITISLVLFVLIPVILLLRAIFYCENEKKE